MKFEVGADLYKKISDGSPDTDFLVVSRQIDRKLHQDVTTLLRGSTLSTNCTLILTTYGGDAHGGYRLARCLRHHYKKLRLVIPSYCKSAGTLIAIAADELAIGDLGELGPVDVQVAKPNELQERGSGLDIMQALSACLNHAQEAFQESFMSMRRSLRLSTRMAGEFASEISAGLLAPLYGQIDPLRIGELQRAMSIALEYGTRLNEHSGNLMDKKALQKLAMSYPAHGFVIDRKEAKTLFKSVTPLSAVEEEICTTLWPIVGDQSLSGPCLIRQIDLGDAHGQPANRAPHATPAQESQPPRAKSRRRRTISTGADAA